MYLSLLLKIRIALDWNGIILVRVVRFGFRFGNVTSGRIEEKEQSVLTGSIVRYDSLQGMQGQSDCCLSRVTLFETARNHFMY